MAARPARYVRIDLSLCLDRELISEEALKSNDLFDTKLKQMDNTFFRVLKASKKKENR